MDELACVVIKTSRKNGIVPSCKFFLLSEWIATQFLLDAHARFREAAVRAGARARRPWFAATPHIASRSHAALA